MIFISQRYKRVGDQLQGGAGQGARGRPGRCRRRSGAALAPVGRGRWPALRRTGGPARRLCVQARASAPAKAKANGQRGDGGPHQFRHRAQRIEQEAERRARPGQREEQAGDGGEQGADDGNGQRLPDAPAHLAQPLGRQIGRKKPATNSPMLRAASAVSSSPKPMSRKRSWRRCRRRLLPQRARLRQPNGEGLAGGAVSSALRSQPDKPSAAKTSSMKASRMLAARRR